MRHATRLKVAAMVSALAIGLLLMGCGTANPAEADDQPVDELVGRGGIVGVVSEPEGSGSSGLGRSPQDHSSAKPGPHGSESTAFADVSIPARLTATHTAPKSKARRLGYLYLITGQGWGDYDRDGWVDLYVTNQLGPNTLYHNQGDGTFRVSPLSEAVSLPEDVSGGAVFADYDNDGWPDLYVLNHGRDVLFHNEEGRGFTDVTERAGLRDESPGMTASWGDYDRDGYLDLYVVNRVHRDVMVDECSPCVPKLADGAQDLLYHNEGDGTFTDVTEALKTEGTNGWGFAAGWLDYDNDSDLDLYLVNDVVGTRYLHPNVLLRNDGPGCGQWCFTDVSEASGAGVRVDGMGLAVGDYDGDQNLDLYFTNTGWAFTPLTGPAMLLRNEGDGSFRDAAHEAGTDVDAVGWGTVFLDYDNDGWQDLYVALGFDPEDVGPQATLNRLLHNRGDGTFEDATAGSGASYVDDTLGVASADYNNDGWTDFVVGNIDEGYDLYANTGASGQGNHRLTVRLQGAGPVNRDAVGTRVYLTTTDGHTQMREVMAGSSLGAGNDLALNFGLGEAEVESLRMLWPDGREQAFEEVPSDVLWQLSYGGEPSTSRLGEPAVPRSELGAPQQPTSGGVRAGGYLVPALALLATLGLVGWLLARRLGSPVADRLLAALVIGVLSFQLVHFFEHLLQLGYWFAYPAEQPWITPWGRVATDGLAALSGHHGGRATGTELLHLSGNWITFIGIVALYVALRGWHVGSQRMRATRVAFWLQLVHVLEHVSLTSTFFALGTPIGLSTLFGASFHLEGAWASSIRIWWHFVMVLVPTGAFLLALREFWRARALNTAAPRSTVAKHEAPEHERAAKIPVAQSERRPSVGDGARGSTGQGRR